MDGSGRDGFVFLHGDVGKPKARIFRTNTTPWAAKSTAPWAHDPRLTIVAKCASLRRRPNTRGTKLVTPRQQRPYSAVRATSFFLWSIDQCPREKSYPDFKSNAFVVGVVGGLLVVSGVPTHAAKSVAATKIVKPFVHAKQVQNGTQRHVPKPGEQHTTVGTMVRQFQNQNQVWHLCVLYMFFSAIVNTINY